MAAVVGRGGLPAGDLGTHIRRLCSGFQRTDASVRELRAGGAFEGIYGHRPELFRNAVIEDSRKSWTPGKNDKRRAR